MFELVGLCYCAVLVYCHYQRHLLCSADHWCQALAIGLMGATLRWLFGEPVAGIVSAVLCGIHWSRLPSYKLPTDNKVVLITGNFFFIYLFG